jgi:CRISPR-associated endonuclease/helicase Cas3
MNPPNAPFNDDVEPGAIASGCSVDALAAALSRQARSVWAKSERNDGSESLPLYVHMTDSAGMAVHLWDGWLPRSTRSLISAAAGSEQAGRILVSWLAGIHDLGKVTPTFAGQVPSLADPMAAVGLRMPSPSYPSSAAPHAVCSQILLERWLTEKHGWSKAAARTYAVVPGGHHGVPPTPGLIGDIRDRKPELLGSAPEWRSTQDELADFATRVSGAEDYLDTWRIRPLPEHVQTLVTAIVIMADWIASGDLFSYAALAGDLTGRVSRAWTQLGLRDHWHVVEPQGSASALLVERFGLPDGSRARPVQERALEAVRRSERPGLLIVEAPMGEGKTELSLLCAEILAARTGAGGVFYALPTMATSDAMFDRVHRWVESVPDARGTHLETGYLAHGKARMNDEFRGLVRLGADVGELEWADPDGESDVMVAHTWLTGRKRGLLASFVVGTIDQALFLALKSRHVVLRHLALANKVVVIDEVHASDDYMKEYLKRLLRWLGEYRVPTILMSATLTPADRENFAREYAQHPVERAIRPGGARRRRRGSPDVVVSNVENTEAGGAGFADLREERAYPLLTAISPEGTVEIARPEASGRRSVVSIERIGDSLEDLVAALRESLQHGGAAAVIRNTVVRAQQAYTTLREAFPDADIRLVHARMLARDRAHRESRLRNDLGARAHLDEPVRFGERPLIVVGTQVLEQSLDVDFDVMLSDLAPVDLLLQRMGRLHRHERRNRSSLLTEPRIILTGADWCEDPPLPVKASAFIYGERELLAAVGVLDGCPQNRVRLPDDIARLVADAAEGVFNRPAIWADPWCNAETDALRTHAEKSHRAKAFLLDPPGRGDLVGWLRANIGEADDSAQGQQQVRDTDASLEVLVVRRIDGGIRTLLRHDGTGGDPVATDFAPPARLAYEIADCSLRLPSMLTTPWRFDQVIWELERNAFAGWQQSPVLRGELPLVLDEAHEATLAGVSVRYDDELGLLIGDAAQRADA